jgi:ankyrin repeat protein
MIADLYLISKFNLFFGVCIPGPFSYILHATFIGRFSEVCDIETLVEKLGPEALSSRDEWGYTPAHWAALDGNVEVMRYLVERSAPVDMSCLGTQGPRPIHWACRKGHATVVQVLLSVINCSLKNRDFVN